MELKHKYNLEGEHVEADLEILRNDHAHEFTNEHLDFLRTFPGLCFDGSRFVKIDGDNGLETFIHNFLSASEILFVLSDEAIMEAFEDLSKEKIGSYCILGFSHSETEIFLVGSEEKNKNDIYVYSSITDETVFICNGLENFINNYLYLE